MNALSLVAAVIIAGGAASASEIEDSGPQFVAGSQYTAVLQQNTGRWQLLPINAMDREVTSACAQQVHLPRGVWLVNRDRHGKAELIAPSGTALPPGYRERIALVPCEAAGAQPEALRAPSTLVDWLVENSGAVLVDD